MAKTQYTHSSQNKFFKIVIVSMALLLIPFIAMFFTPQVNWSLFDFLVAGSLLVGTGLIIEFFIKRIKSMKLRWLLLILTLLLLSIIWVELSVGIFDSIISGS